MNSEATSSSAVPSGPAKADDKAGNRTPSENITIAQMIKESEQWREMALEDRKQIKPDPVENDGEHLLNDEQRNFMESTIDVQKWRLDSIAFRKRAEFFLQLNVHCDQQKASYENVIMDRICREARSMHVNLCNLSESV